MSKDHHWILDCVADSSRVIGELAGQLERITAICELVTSSLLSGKKLLTAGNGGSAAAALHLAEELTGRYSRPDRRALPAICLAADATALTCIANDWDFASVFSRQVEAFAQSGDVLVVFSSSGNSENLIRACQTMRQRGGKVIGLLGKGGGKNLAYCDQALVVSSQRSAAIQESHEVVLHLILEYLEKYCD
ncbi:MAG: SIS domain-containing protein [Planctomycetia bacterium]|nr:SIS domain-containing protein [Planctomycetia bacterium]